MVKLLPIGPKAQAILKEWLRHNEDEFLFQPGEARKTKYEQRRKNRKTPLWRSHVAHQDRKRKKKPKRVPRDHYDRHTYARAIARACQKAGVPHWHPHQLKHVLRDRCAQAIWPGGIQGLHGPHEAVHRRNLRREGHGTGREDRPGNGLASGECRTGRIGGGWCPDQPPPCVTVSVPTSSSIPRSLALPPSDAGVGCEGAEPHVRLVPQPGSLHQ